MAQSARPYQGVPHSDLRRAIRQYEKRIRENEREQELIGWSNISDEGWQGAQRNIDADLRHIRDIEEEFNQRRLRQIQREQAEERRMNQAQSAPLPNATRSSTIEVALDQWFSQQSLAKPHRINVNWYINDRQYFAWYTPKTGAIEVAIVVAPGTPGSFKRGGKFLLPADTPAELKIALAAPAPPNPNGRR